MEGPGKVIESKSSDPLNYYSQLDGLRCFAVLSVMIGHLVAWDTKIYLVRNIPWGHGVTLFFVLSGYLITNILFTQKEKMEHGRTGLKQSLVTFYTRRTLRIFPVYYLLLLFLFFINYENTREIIVWLASFTINIFQCVTGQFVGNFNHFWSLAVEEQFYLIWPLLILITPRKYLLRLIAGVILLSFLSKVCCNVYTGNWMYSAYFTLNNFLPLVLGALLAFGARYDMKIKSFFSSVPLMWLSIVMYVLFYYTHKMHPFNTTITNIFDDYAFAFACAFVIFRASTNGFRYAGRLLLSNKVVVFVGKISYSLYLYHLFMSRFYWVVIDSFFGLYAQNMVFVRIMYFVLALVVSSATYFIIELPINKLKKKFPY